MRKRSISWFLPKKNVNILVKNKEFGHLLKGYLDEKHLFKDATEEDGKGYVLKTDIPVFVGKNGVTAIDPVKLKDAVEGGDTFDASTKWLLSEAVKNGYNVEIIFDEGFEGIYASNGGYVGEGVQNSSETQQLLSTLETVRKEVKTLRGNLDEFGSVFDEVGKNILQAERGRIQGTVSEARFLKFYNDMLDRFSRIIKNVRPRLYANDSFNGVSGVINFGNGAQIFNFSIVAGGSSDSACEWMPVEYWAPQFSGTHY